MTTFYNTPAGIPMQLIYKPAVDGYGGFGLNGVVIKDFKFDECTHIEEPANPLAPQMLQAAYDAFEHEKWWLLWEFKSTQRGSEWIGVCYQNEMFMSGFEYRRIEPKKTFMCNGVELVDDRVTELPVRGTDVWIVDLTTTSLVLVVTCHNEAETRMLMGRGLAHHTKEGAIAHAKALLGEE